MPHSSNLLDQQVIDFLKTKDIKSILDVGAGAGKYYDICRNIFPNALITAVEPDIDYHKDYNYESKYNSIITSRTQDLINSPINYYDVVIMGDVIEHMKKSDGLDFINYIIYRCNYLIIKYPLKYIQEDVEGHWLERHLSVWGITDFIPYDLIIFYSDYPIELAIIKGYQ